MKKILIAILIVVVLINMPVRAEETEIDKVREFLLNYSSNIDTFYVEEYPSIFDGKDLFVRISAVPEDILSNSKYDLVTKRDDFFEEMTKQNWFDYKTIYCIMFSENTGFMAYNKYSVERGIYSLQDGTSWPWIIKTEGDMPQENKLFLGRVAQELLFNNISGVVLETEKGWEEKLSIEECAGIAVVRGQFEKDGKTYNYVTEFTYEMESEYDGTYDTIYIGVNDIDLYGEYSPIELIEVK